MEFNARIVFKLIFWSFIVGAILYWLDWTPADVWGWLFDTVSSIWQWISGTGLQYILVGAAIVVPIYLFRQFTGRKKTPPAPPKE